MADKCKPCNAACVADKTAEAIIPSLWGGATPSETKSCCHKSLGSKLRPRLELVIAHNDEDLTWVKSFLAHPDIKVRIFKKSGYPSINKLDEPYTKHLEVIVGHGHTYVHHIVNNWDRLGETVVFCQGNPFQHFAEGYSPEDMLAAALKTSSDEFMTFPGNQMMLFDQWDFLPRSVSIQPLQDKWYESPAPVYPPREYWNLFMGHILPQVATQLGYISGSNFAVGRLLIEKLGKEFWALVNDEIYQGAMIHREALNGSYMDCFWGAIFSPEKFILMAGEESGGLKDGSACACLAKDDCTEAPNGSCQAGGSNVPTDQPADCGVNKSTSNVCASNKEKKGNASVFEAPVRESFRYGPWYSQIYRYDPTKDVNNLTITHSY
ncbi:hypothetical protein RUND412_004664 [Rhizina undulata]